MKTLTIIIRILALPFILGMLLIKANFGVLYMATLFVMHGGEWSSYRKDDKKKIADIFEKLSQN